jgi:hypothetical protein
MDQSPPTPYGKGIDSHLRDTLAAVARVPAALIFAVTVVPAALTTRERGASA